MMNEYPQTTTASTTEATASDAPKHRLEKLRPEEQHRVLMYYAEVLPERLKRGVYSNDQVDGMRQAVSKLPESPMRDEVLRQINGHVKAAFVRY